MTTARDMLAMLRRHYLPDGRQPAGIFAPEIAAPASTRRADLIWQDVTIAGKGRLIEILGRRPPASAVGLAHPSRSSDIR